MRLGRTIYFSPESRPNCYVYVTATIRSSQEHAGPNDQLTSAALLPIVLDSSCYDPNSPLESRYEYPTTIREFIITLSPHVLLCTDYEIGSHFRSRPNLRLELRWFRWRVGNIRSHLSSTDSDDSEERVSAYLSKFTLGTHVLRWLMYMP